MDDELMDLAGRLARVDGVVGVCLGGSRARGTHRPDSDYDLGLYYRRPLDTGQLRDLARQLTGKDVDVTEPGGWGPWVDGGAWLTVDGHRVDWLYRDLDRVAHSAREARAGRYEIGTQPGHPLGVHSHAYAGELALGRVLADPGGEVTRLRAELADYPVALGEALVAQARWEAPFVLAGARKGAARGDAFYVHGCLFRAVGALVQAMHGRAGQWLINEKGAVASAALLPGAPEHFAERVRAVFAGDDLNGAVDAALALVQDALG
ncbi:nucleotidyltransferase domain-containing protein [Kitasatospora terrestris]|uniref:Nucleotidyltransferase domain-containing protein n=1 Tax=Kitasatospora terrestris TaxID=258051 RepID=A0ABP9EGS0_9ACTN